MQLQKIKVKGQLGLELEFDQINVILGENNTGKSTLMNLIIYALGSRVDHFIDEIKSGLCKQVELDVQCKSGNSFRIIRALPKSDVVTITPFDEHNQLLEEEIELLELAEFSDFLLEEEGYNASTISYGKNNKASLRLYFLLRAVFVDQNTPASEILANIGGDGSSFLNNQKLIKKAVIEELLGRENNQVQKLRFELQQLIKERQEINSKHNFIKEMIEQELNEHKNLTKDIKKIQKEIEIIEVEKSKLSESHTNYLLKLKGINEWNLDEDIVSLKQQNERINDHIRSLKLEIMDVDNVKKQAENELEALKKKIVARQFLTQIPVDSCPICLSDFQPAHQEGICPLCNAEVDPYNQEKALQYKKLLEESIVESRLIKEDLEQELVSEISQKEKNTKVIDEKRKKYLEEMKKMKTPLEEIIQSIKDRFEYLIQNGEVYRNFLKTLESELEIRSQKKDVNGTISEVREELTNLEGSASVSDIHKIETWESLFRDTLQYIFGDVQKASLDENLLPLVDGNEMRNVSSASLKVAARLAYVLSLFKLKDEEDIHINHLGFLLFDSPRDKDLDQDKFKRFLEQANDIDSGQLILTGSIKEKDLYESVFEDEKFLVRLYDDDKLLKKID
ncbi:AAA domain-containing protein [Cytobacillus oceanisediminis]|uniref:AAA domain-containing protein n=1 Tax=Cytobacillus oceanisediminis TaxID=665099 RepID=A0A2V3A2S9_9BACI|nr:AAA family ATPase [Cytobacillus oceanisediminis]PWW30557.1 AAA domain-containing protein [Cytobacillus oceanisediminis]